MTPYEYAHIYKERFVEQLCEFLGFPSISTLPEHQGDVHTTAQWLAQHMRVIGFERAEVIPTARHPIVYGEWTQAGSSAPTLLFYGHYDVQPVDPIELWATPPFKPTIVDGKVFARGATDDKGQVFAHLKAVESLLQTTGALPCNVKVLVEGEEEIGSPHLVPFLQAERQRVNADAVVISDTAMLAPDIPTLVYGLRGLVYMELHVYGPRRDLHSGSYGGAIVNPANALAQMLCALHTENGSVSVPGFYDEVVPLSDNERSMLASLPFDYEAYERDLGVQAVGGERDLPLLERISARPTLDVNGIWSGFTGTGAKTVLPASAHAKISMRLVPNQKADIIAERVEQFLRACAPAGVRVNIEQMQGCDPVLVDHTSLPMQAASRALARTFGRAPVFVREGGSIPIVSEFQRLLNVPVVLMGFGLHSDGAHSPNEHFHLANYHRGIAATIAFVEEFARAR